MVSYAVFFCLRMKGECASVQTHEKHFYFDHSVKETGLPEKHFQSISKTNKLLNAV